MNSLPASDDKDGLIAIVEDDPGIRELVVEMLRREGFDTAAFGDAAAFRAADIVQRVDCLILDLMLPGENGLTTCQDLRSKWPRLPILIVTAKREQVDRIVGLELGADDYLAKPFNSRELLARVRSIIRRTRALTAPTDAMAGDSYRFAGWVLRTRSRDLTDPDGNHVPLTSGEFDLLHAFVSHPQRILSRDQLLDWTRGRMSTPFDRAIDVQLSRVRRKLGDDPRDPMMIRTVRGDGYLFAVSVTTC